MLSRVIREWAETTAAFCDKNTFYHLRFVHFHWICFKVGPLTESGILWSEFLISDGAFVNNCSIRLSLFETDHLLFKVVNIQRENWPSLQRAEKRCAQIFCAYLFAGWNDLWKSWKRCRSGIIYHPWSQKYILPSTFNPITLNMR